MIKSIESVTKEITVFLENAKKQKEEDRTHVLLSAIDLVVKSRTERHTSIIRIIHNQNLLLSSVSSVAGKLETSFPQPTHPLFLSHLNRQRDENLHSDYLAAIIRQHPEVIALLNLSGGFLSVVREPRLDYFDSSLKDSNLGARRIDLLIETTKEFLIIENKIDSTERLDQTEDYYQVIKSVTNKEVKGLMLSPLGLDPKCDHYRKMTYYQLFLILNQVEKKSPLLDYYLAELFSIFIKPFNNRRER